MKEKSEKKKFSFLERREKIPLGKRLRKIRETLSTAATHGETPYGGYLNCILAFKVERFFFVVKKKLANYRIAAKNNVRTR